MTQNECRRLEALMSLDGVSGSNGFRHSNAAKSPPLRCHRHPCLAAFVWDSSCHKQSGRYWVYFQSLASVPDDRLRQFAEEFHVSARDIERSLFSVHQAYQKGTLYAR